jgi:gamma-glutamylcyclotransferase (GGCT)/AIG2-like uncharacterized protein YtfP
LLYFAYTARIEPSKMAEVAPGATFEFIAHLLDWGLEFPISGNGWKGGLPSVRPSEGDTVWGAVFAVSDAEASALDAVESAEQRHRHTVEAIDRIGRRHQVTTHVAADNGAGQLRPAPDYVALMLDGSRHWELPAGWIVRLEDHLTG